MNKIVLLKILIIGVTTLSVFKYMSERNFMTVNAEQSGSSPDSGTGTSILKTGYDWLVAKGTNYGATQPADWTSNWGTYWNRIMYSAFWEPDGDATESDVLSGKTFYSGNNNRTMKTGSKLGIDYSQQSYVQYYDYSVNSYIGEESTWINTNTSASTGVWLDTRTGTYWAGTEATTLTNSFSSPATSDCSFFLTTPRGNYGNSSTEPECGEAINACAVLSLAAVSGSSANTDWYLPSQKELVEAYVDGMYSEAGSAFTKTSSFWSSTEDSISNTSAWRVLLYNASCINSPKTTAYVVHCVRRD